MGMKPPHSARDTEEYVQCSTNVANRELAWPSSTDV